MGVGVGVEKGVRKRWGVGGRGGRTSDGISAPSRERSPGIQSEFRLLQRTPWISSRWSPSRRSWSRWRSPRWAGTPAAEPGPAAHWLNRTQSWRSGPDALRGRNLPQPAKPSQALMKAPVSAHCVPQILPLPPLYMEATGLFLQGSSPITVPKLQTTKL